MAEHFTRNTETATAWCKKCGRNTEHRIDGGRKGPCINKLHPTPAPEKPKPAPQKGLFDE